MSRRLMPQLQRINTIFVSVVFIVTIGILFSSTAVDFRWFPAIALVSLLLLADLTVFSYIRSKNIFSFRNIFLTLTFLFHMGYSWIFIFNPSFSFAGMDFEVMFDATLVLKSYLFSLSVSLGVYLGMCVGDVGWTARSTGLARRLRVLGDKLIISRKMTALSYRNMGIFILALTLPVRLYIDIGKYSLSSAGDYLSTFDLEVNGYVAMFADMSIIGIVLMMIYFRNKVLIASSIMAGSITYYLISMGSGSRGAAIISIVILLFAYTLCVRRFRAITIAAIGVLGIVLAGYVTSIGMSRVDSSAQLDEKYGTQSRFLQEFGGTQLTTILTMRLVDGEGGTGYAGGETYFASLLTILPNLTPEYESYIEKNNFQKQLNYPTIGGSYVAELYYNFGYFALFASLVVGFLLSRFEGFMTKLRNDEKFILLAFLIFIARQALWWIRDTALVFPRHVVVGGVVLIILCLLMQKLGLIRVLADRKDLSHGK